MRAISSPSTTSSPTRAATRPFSARAAARRPTAPCAICLGITAVDPDDDQASVRPLHLREAQRAARHRRRFRARAARGGDPVHLSSATAAIAPRSARPSSTIARAAPSARSARLGPDARRDRRACQDGVGLWRRPAGRSHRARPGSIPANPAIRQAVALASEIDRFSAPSLPACRRLRAHPRAARRDGADRQRRHGRAHLHRMGQGRHRHARPDEGRCARARHAELHPARARSPEAALRQGLLAATIAMPRG